MVTLKTAENALKTVYLGVVSDQINTKANPLLTKIKQTTSDVWGKEVVKLAPYSLTNGFGAGDETGELPQAGSNKYAQFRAELKNLYGKIELSDKAIRASQSSSGAFVNLLNSEMEGLVKASTYNLGRMLFGDGTGKLAQDVSLLLGMNHIAPQNINNFYEGMVCEFFPYIKLQDVIVTTNSELRTVTMVDRINGVVYFNDTLPQFAESNDYCVVMKNCLNKEILGLEAIFGNSETLYGVDRENNAWMKPFNKENAGSISDVQIQEAIDFLDEAYGSDVDYICCASNVKRLYQDYLSSFRRNIDYMELTGGFKAMSYGGIPIVSDRFVKKGDMFLLNTKEFNLHQLCDWTWLEGDDGRILKQNAGYPTYSATLVKYAELICDKPAGQAKISGIVASGNNAIDEIASNTKTIAEKSEQFVTDYEIVNIEKLS